MRRRVVGYCWESGKCKPCYGMRKFALSIAAIQTKLSGYTVRIYKCSACRCFHLTHQPQPNDLQGAA